MQFRNFLKRPIITQAIQVSIFMGSGDLIAQKFIEKRKTINLERTARFAGIGLFLVGPSLSVWYKKLDKIFLKQTVPWKKAASKVALDQLLFAPIFLIIITSALSFVQGMNFDQIENRLKENYLTILMTNYKIWPLAQLVNFAFVPLSYQVIFVQCVALIWNTYLSVKLSQ